MQPRREVWEYGALPLQSLCPQLDGVQTLFAFHGKLFARSKEGRNGHRTVTLYDVCHVLELTATQGEVLTEVLAALSYANAAPGSGSTAYGGSTGAASGAGAGTGVVQASAPPPPFGQEDIFLHELSLFLLEQLFSKEAQRADAVEYWPDAAGSGSGLGGFGGGFGGGGFGGGGFGPGQELMSPTRRGQSGRGLLRQQLQSHLRQAAMASRGFGDYLRRQLRPALELCCEGAGWPAGPGALVGPRELARMGFLLAAPGSGEGGDALAAALAAATHGSATAPLAPMTLEAAAAALRGMWAEEGGGAGLESPRLLALSGSFGGGASMGSPSPKFQRAMGMVAPAGQVDDSAISGVYRGTVVRGEGDLPHGDVRVSDCHEAIIYILAPLQAALVVGCSDCTIVVGAVGRLLRLERCDKVQVIAATNRLLVSACHECTINVGTPRPPCLLGDNRFLKLGPYNTRYERQPLHAREAGLRTDAPNRFDCPLVLVGKGARSMGGSAPGSPRPGLASSSSPGGGAPGKAGFSLQPPDEVLPFVVPFAGGPGPLAGGSAPPNSTRWSQVAAVAARGGAGSAGGGSDPRGASGGGGGMPLYLFPLPPEYERALQRRLGMTHDMRLRFKQAGLTKERERELNDAIQGHFKEWLASSNLLRQIYDLSTLEKEEIAAAGRQ